MAKADLVEALLDALAGVDGLRPATPLAPPNQTWMWWDWQSLAVDLDDEVVRIRFVATKLPLPPLLRAAEDAVRPLLRGTAWEAAVLTLVVADIDGEAFTPMRDRDHTIGS